MWGRLAHKGIPSINACPELPLHCDKNEPRFTKIPGLHRPLERLHRRIKLKFSNIFREKPASSINFKVMNFAVSKKQAATGSIQ